MAYRTAESGKSNVRPGTWAAAAAGVATAILPFAGATTGQLLVFALLALAAAPWAVLPVRRSRPYHKYALAVALSITLAAFAVDIRWQQEHPEPEVNSPSPANAASHLKFLPVAEPIPHCVTFSGTGTIPSGHALVLFDRSVDPAGYYTSSSTFSYDGPVEKSGNGWTAPAVDIGSGDPSDNGNHIAIVAMLVPQNVADFLDNLTSSSNSGQVPQDVLSLGTQADRIVTLRNGQDSPC